MKTLQRGRALNRIHEWKGKVCANKGRSFIRPHTLYLKSRGNLRATTKKTPAWVPAPLKANKPKGKETRDMQNMQGRIKESKKETFLQLTLFY